MEYVLEFELYICKDVLEEIYVFKLVLKPLEFKFMFGTNVFVKQVLYM